MSKEKLTLAELEGDDFARRAQQRAEAEIAIRGGSMEPAAKERLLLVAVDILNYAKSGESSASTGDQLVDFCTCVFGLPPDRVPIDEYSALSTVVVAARTRAMLCRDDGGVADVPSSGIAALAGVDPSYIRRIGREGKIRRQPNGLYTGPDARRWLAARKVSGFEKMEET